MTQGKGINWGEKKAEMITFFMPLYLFLIDPEWQAQGKFSLQSRYLRPHYWSQRKGKKENRPAELHPAKKQESVAVAHQF